ncbi:MAG: bifunctional glutamate N-acetyltransferase/amino-acid acetyltransferase ArgJ [Chloroflexi bacterium]|nr:bifunctional glutamate N-acetyltransferase/amino-acid acetyltransferase ArgJ [Chloroflexota bacterium]MYD66442.1 bifunctional glutamate N-acetyltransferase/amino-acid acetyltransferase ArgJ [Chloroflexota bacterium]
MPGREPRLSDPAQAVEARIETIEGGVTAPAGFLAGGAYAGIKTYGPEPRLDVGILAADRDCTVAGVYTRNAVVGEPVRLTRERAAGGVARAIVANSGCSNVATGEQGVEDALRMTALAAAKLGVDEQHVLVASTGVIGRLLPMDRIESGVRAVDVTETGGEEFARAIMTTDTHPKQAAVRVEAGGRTYTIGGVAKGSGMIHPDMATMFGFLTTDAPAEQGWLQATLRRVCDRSFNMVDVDMDTSTSDTVLLLASGAAGGEPVRDGHPAADALEAAIEAVSVTLARQLARDGEGANTLIEVVVEGAASDEDARVCARTISSSPLVKTMVTGRDPNWGRVLMAAGRSGAAIDLAAASVWIGEHIAFDRGTPAPTSETAISAAMDAEEVGIRIDLASGEATATAWGCDLTAEYVSINADYTT